MRRINEYQMFLIILVFAFLFSLVKKDKNYENLPKTSIAEAKLDLTQESENYNPFLDTVSIKEMFNTEDYGVTPNGTFFISTKLIGNPEEVLLTIIESDSTNTKNNGIYEDASNREIIRMKKEGGYFLGKSNKQYLNPAFYFKVENWKCIPYFMTEKFKKDDIIQNQCGGLLLNKQNKIN